MDSIYERFFDIEARLDKLEEATTDIVNTLMAIKTVMEQVAERNEA